MALFYLACPLLEEEVTFIKDLLTDSRAGRETYSEDDTGLDMMANVEPLCSAAISDS